jgi:signal transduction histidine kinase
MSPGTPLPHGRSVTAAEGASASRDSTTEAAARLRILVDISRRLAETKPDFSAVLDAVTAQVVEVLGDGCAAYLCSTMDSRLEPIAIRHRSPARQALIEQVNQTRQLRVGEGLVGRTVAAGETLYLPEADPALLRGVVVPEYLAYLERVGVRSLLVVPLLGKDRVHGALWLARDPGSEPYSQADRELIETISVCAAMALESTRLHAAHAADRQRLAEAASRTQRLQQVTAALSGAATPDEVAAVVAHLAVASMEGVAGSLVLPTPAGDELEIVAHVGHGHAPHLVERFRRLPLHANNPVAHAFRDAAPLYFEDLDRWAELYPSLLASAAEAGYVAGAALPLVARDECLGVLWVRFATRRAFDAEERQLMSTMVSQSAQALERSRLYMRARQAVAQRDEFLSVAAHELRTPLTSLKLQSESLRRDVGRLAIQDDASARLAARAEAVGRQVQRLESLVNDLLDLSRITAGKLALNLEEFDLRELAREGCDRMADELARAGCALALRAEVPAVGQWDRARLDQVLTNLLSNAAKYGAGGPIEVTVSMDGSQARLAVRDSGIGISPEDHGRIFERFERAVPGRNYSGFGVGLWICKQIVQSLGGAIRVSSRLGEGSTFEVELPCRRDG